MELFVRDTEYVISDRSSVLRCSRHSGHFEVGPGSYTSEHKDCCCVGLIYGIVGVVTLPEPESEKYLLLISKRKFLGKHPLGNAEIYEIVRVSALPIVHAGRFDHSQFDSCPEHTSKVYKFSSEPFNKVAFIKKVTDRTTNFQFGASKATHDRLLDEILQLFNEYGSFYYSPSLDLTRNVQGLLQVSDGDGSGDCGNRFFWNRHLIEGLLVPPMDAYQRWVTPIIYGYVFFHHCKSLDLQLLLISRRSVWRAGTRYIKRGVDDHGHCANYVESEQIVVAFKHYSSFVVVRASVPAFWSQPGYKYRPPPVISRPRSDNLAAFVKHLDQELSVYHQLVVVNLVEQTGKEKVLSDTYLDLVLEANRPAVTYVAFDFNAHCRGLRFENVHVLIDALRDVLDDMKFCWVDKNHEVVCRQSGVVRVNCVDCLDRTNLVQTAVAKYVFEITLRKFGLMTPDECLNAEVDNLFRVMWANNGDYISRQYTGTVALKSDFTRTGERCIVGIMKDGYRSANRYYLCHMKDAKRQFAIDCLLANAAVASRIGEPTAREREGADSEWTLSSHEQIRLLVQDCEKLLVTDDEVIVGSWALIDASECPRLKLGEELDNDMDTVVILTRSSYCVCEYEEDADNFVNFQRIPLSSVVTVQIGPARVASILGLKQVKAVCIRITYRSESGGVQRHTWRAANTRLFNNIAIQIRNVDEADEYIRAVGEQFVVALRLVGNCTKIEYCAKLANPTSPVHLPRRASQSVYRFGGFTPVASVRRDVKTFGSKLSLLKTKRSEELKRALSKMKPRSSLSVSHSPSPDSTSPREALTKYREASMERRRRGRSNSLSASRTTDKRLFDDTRTLPAVGVIFGQSELRPPVGNAELDMDTVGDSALFPTVNTDNDTDFPLSPADIDIDVGYLDEDQAELGVAETKAVRVDHCSPSRPTSPEATCSSGVDSDEAQVLLPALVDTNCLYVPGAHVASAGRLKSSSSDSSITAFNDRRRVIRNASNPLLDKVLSGKELVVQFGKQLHAAHMKLSSYAFSSSSPSSLQKDGYYAEFLSRIQTSRSRFILL